MAIDVNYQRNNITIFRGTTIVGFVGLLNAIRLGPTKKSFSENGDCTGYSVSIDARDKGGYLFQNILEGLLFKKAMTPEQHLRKSFESVIFLIQLLKLFDFQF